MLAIRGNSPILNLEVCLSICSFFFFPLYFVALKTPIYLLKTVQANSHQEGTKRAIIPKVPDSASLN